MFPRLLFYVTKRFCDFCEIVQNRVYSAGVRATKNRMKRFQNAEKDDCSSFLICWENFKWICLWRF